MQNMSQYIWPTYSIRWAYVKSPSKFKETIEASINKEGNERLDKGIDERINNRWMYDRWVDDWWILIENEIE